MRGLKLLRSTGWRTRSILSFAARNFSADWWPDPQMEADSCGASMRSATPPTGFCGGSSVGALKFVPHHLAHAASAYYPSGFDPAAILVIDGIGEAACSTLARGEGARIETIETFSYPHSLGFVWEQASIYLGFSPYDASKVMGLAAYGDPDVYRRQLASVIQVSEDSYQVDLAALGFPSFDPQGFEPLLGPRRKPEEEILPRHMHFAAALQDATDAAVRGSAAAARALRQDRGVCALPEASRSIASPTI